MRAISGGANEKRRTLLHLCMAYASQTCQTGCGKQREQDCTGRWSPAIKDGQNHEGGDEVMEAAVESSQDRPLTNAMRLAARIQPSCLFQ